MKKTVKRLSVDRQTIRNLVSVELGGAAGGRINPTVSLCETECPPGTGDCTTTGPATGGNICLKTEFTCRP
jgi:hypothetical protein